MKPLLHPTELQIQEFADEFISSSDRVLVLAAVSLIDSGLTEFLRIRLLTSRRKEKEKDELFDPERPLGSFSAKIDLAYRLRLIDAALADVLHFLR